MDSLLFSIHKSYHLPKEMALILSNSDGLISSYYLIALARNSKGMLNRVVKAGIFVMFLIIGIYHLVFQ
jgi:hypothetical protein